MAIGGIGLESLAAVMQAGADAVAVATAICRGDITQNAHAFVQIIKKGSRVRGFQGSGDF